MTPWRPSLEGHRGPTYLALANAIADAIESGALTPGARLPPRRDLAHDLGISVNTVSSAYVEAERRGHVVGEVGRGTFVRRRSEETFTGGHPEGHIDLSICRPCVLHDQIPKLRDALRTAADDPDLAAMLWCRPLIGLPPHRLAAARWLYKMGMPADPADIVITNGCAHGMLVALSTIVEPDDVVVTDALTDHGLISLASFLHFNLRPLASDRDGLIPDAVEAAVRKGGVKALVTTPNLNNPTSSLMPAERREKIAAICHQYGVAIVEDDVFGALVEDRPPPLSSFHPDDSYYVTSFTKVSVSGLRVGFLVGPPKNTQRLAARVRTTSWMATPLVADIAARWIEDGTMDEIVAGQRRELAARQALVEHYLAEFDTISHPTGPNVWINLPGDWRADGLVRQLQAQGVLVTASEPFVVGRSAGPHAVRLSVGGAETRADLERALELVRADLSQRPEPALIDV
ncbi:MAG: PLP-dependent aminotransferase family protein [Caenispirillum bisanense]|nr:PLP-dependent aminotransferase family protein [Caenispirillum bisanense]MCA1973172.1 PLP-dependent aminotransferase family protein [Caenispirillum sp.]